MYLNLSQLNGSHIATSRRLRLILALATVTLLAGVLLAYVAGALPVSFCIPSTVSGITDLKARSLNRTQIGPAVVDAWLRGFSGDYLCPSERISSFHIDAVSYSQMDGSSLVYLVQFDVELPRFDNSSDWIFSSGIKSGRWVRDVTRFVWVTDNGGMMSVTQSGSGAG